MNSLGRLGSQKVFGPKRRVCVVFPFGVFSAQKQMLKFWHFPSWWYGIDGSLKTPCLTLLRPLYQEVGWKNSKKPGETLGFLVAQNLLFFLGGLLGWGTTSQGNLAFPYAMVIQSLVANAIGYIVNQRIWQFTNQMLAKTTNRWGRKSLQKIRQHHQIWEEISTVCTILSAVLDPWKRRWILEIQVFFRFRIRWRCTPAPKVRVFHQIVQSLRPTNSEMTWKLENGLKCRGTEGPQLGKVEFANSMSQNGRGLQWNLRFEAVIFLYLLKKKNLWDNKLLKSGVATTTKPTNSSN